MKIQAALLREELARIIQAQSEACPTQPPEFPTELVERVVLYVLSQRQRGRTVAQCAQELGLPKGRLHYWLYQRCRRLVTQQPPPCPQPTSRPPSPLRPVQVAAEVVPVYDGIPERRYRLRSPSGWELQDLSLAELVELLRSLA